MTDFQNPSPARPPSAWDEEYIRMLLEGSGMPNPVSVPNQIDDYGGVLTDFNKVGNMGTDLDFALMTNQLGPEAFDPITTYDPVQAPGLQRLEEYKVGNPLQQAIALAIIDGARGSEILRRVQEEAAIDPTLMDYVPRQFQENMATGLYEESDAPDLRALQMEISDLETSVGSDPMYERNPDGTPMLDPRTGQPMSATTENSPARQMLLDAGYTSDPQATYDPYMLAAPGRFEYDQGLREDFSTRQSALPATQGSYERALGLAQDSRRDDMSYPGQLEAWASANRQERGPGRGFSPTPPSNPTVPDQGRMSLFERAIAPSSPRPDQGRMSLFERAASSTPSAGGSWDARSTRPSPRDPAATLALQKEAARQGIQYRKDSMESRLAEARNNFARDDHQQRQAMVEEMLRRGRAPIYDEIASRNAHTYGGALG